MVEDGRMTEVRRALLFSTAERYLTLGINFTTLAVVSRILTPAEIGVSVVGTAIVGVAITVREFASTSFIIQRQDLRPEDVRGAFTVMLALTTLTTLALAVAAPFIAEAYGQAGLAAYFGIVCLCLFVELASVQVTTLLRRDLAFGRVAAINLAGAVAGASATIGLALGGFSYMSFAWGWLAAAAVSALVALALRPKLSSFLPTLRNWRGMLSFGGYNGANVLLYKLFEQVPYLVLGRAVSPDAAAMFSRTLTVCQLPDRVALGGSTAVMLPAFAAAARQGRSLRAPYLKGIAWATGLLWPAHVTLAVLAYPIVDLLLGPQWEPAARLIQIVAIASLFSFSFELNYPVLVAVGAIRDAFLRALVVFPIAAVVVAAAAIYGGLEATAWSLMLVIPFHAWVALHFVRRRLGIRWGEILAALRKSAVVAAATGIGPLAVAIQAGGFDMSLAHGVAGAALAAAGWLAGLRLARHPLAEELPQIAALVLGTMRRPRLAETAGG
jgi:O-antigen/teichoic acid export membrane protein